MAKFLIATNQSPAALDISATFLLSVTDDFDLFRTERGTHDRFA
jgi:hypothetical protein